MTANTWSAADYQRHGGFVAELGAPLLDLLAAGPGQIVLDLGCGDGRLTERIAATRASVVGVDASPELVAAARARGLDARLMDGHALEFDAAFDAVFSNAALHWMPQPGAVLTGVRRALKPGGRFVGEFGGHGNVAAITTALDAALERAGIRYGDVDPWYFPTDRAYRALLEAHGFTVDSIALFPRPTVLPTDLAGWLATFAGPLVAELAPDARASVLAEVVARLRRPLCDERGQWTADYVRLRFAATRN